MSPAYVRAAVQRLGRPASCVVYVLFSVDDDSEVARAKVAGAVDEFASGDVDGRLAKLGVVETVLAADRIDRYAVAGTPVDCARAIDALVAAGATSVVVVPQPLDHEAQLRRFAADVLPLIGR